MDGRPLLVTRDGSVATLTLNRPDVGNAIDIALADAILAAALECDADDSIRCVVLTGAGRTFCAGGDVAAFAAAGADAPALIRRLTASLHMAVARLLRMRKPVITAVNGAAAGAGIGLAVLGDVALAAQTSRFVMGYDALGVTPDAGASWLLPRLIGLRQAQRMMLLGEHLDAANAERVGLITRVVPNAALAGEAQSLAARMALGPVEALARTRMLLLSGSSDSLESHMESEAQSISAAAGGREGQEGISAFAAKRAANFIAPANGVPGASA